MSEYSTPFSMDEPSPEIKFQETGFEIGSETIAKNDPNQDAILVNKSLGLFAVFDGAGGHEGGADASQVAKHSIESAISNNKSLSLSRVLDDASKIVGEQSPGLTTTAIVKVVEGSQTEKSCRIQFASVGDSRVYIFASDGSLRQVTTDNVESTTNEEYLRLAKEKQDRLSAVSEWTDILREDEPAFNTRNIIHQAIGKGYEVSPIIYEAEINEGDMVLITTDGVHDNLTDEEITSLVGVKAAEGLSPQDIANLIAQKSFERSNEGHLRSKADDTSIVVMKYKGGGFDSKPAEELGSNIPEGNSGTRAENFAEIDLEKDVPVEFNLESLPFPLKLYLGVYELQLSLDEREGRPPALVVAVPGKSVGEYLSGKFAAEIPASEVPNIITLGRTQKIEELLGVEFPNTVSHNHLEITYGNGRLILKDTSTNGTSLRR
jgi:protein phosphatase